ncbi:hypothetical protein Tco_0337800 [Tanacetum coccineum]
MQAGWRNKYYVNGLEVQLTLIKELRRLFHLGTAMYITPGRMAEVERPSRLQKLLDEENELKRSLSSMNKKINTSKANNGNINEQMEASSKKLKAMTAEEPTLIEEDEKEISYYKATSELFYNQREIDTTNSLLSMFQEDEIRLKKHAEENNELQKRMNQKHLGMSKEVGTPRYLSLVVLLEKVGDEAVYKELGDIMERAATTASSFEAEQDSGSGPRCQDTILGDMDAQTRFEITSKQSNDPPLSRGYTLGSGEDRKITVVILVRDRCPYGKDRIAIGRLRELVNFRYASYIAYEDIVDLTGDEDLTDEDRDIGMSDSTGVSSSLGGEIFLGGKKSWESTSVEIDSEDKRSLVKSSKKLGEVFPGEARE